VLGFRADARDGTTLCKGLTFSDASVNAWAERSCSQICSHGADFADVRERSPVSKSLVALRIRSLANGGEHAAQDWGSRGRRFKSCHPDGKQQVIPEGAGPCQGIGDLSFGLSSTAAHTSR